MRNGGYPDLCKSQWPNLAIIRVSKNIFEVRWSHTKYSRGKIVEESLPEGSKIAVVDMICKILTKQRHSLDLTLSFFIYYWLRYWIKSLMQMTSKRRARERSNIIVLEKDKKFILYLILICLQSFHQYQKTLYFQFYQKNDVIGFQSLVGQLIGLNILDPLRC